MSKLSKSQKPSQKNSRRVCPKCHGRGWLNKSHYSQGRLVEYKVRDYLTERGWNVTRSYGSKGVYDLIAEKNGWRLGIQVKGLSSKNKSYLTPKDRLALNQELDVQNQPDTYYKMYVWRGLKQPPKEVLFDYPIDVIHVYKDGPKMVWKKLIEKDVWVDFKL